MAVFAQIDRLRLSFAGKGRAAVVGIVEIDDVGVFGIAAAAVVVEDLRTAGIDLAGQLGGGDEMAAPARFVGQRPPEDGRMVAVGQDHLGGLLADQLPVAIARRPAERGFALDEHAELVGGLHQRLVGRVVAGAEKIGIALAEQLDVAAGNAGGKRPAGGRIDFVVVAAADLDRQAVDEQLVAAHLDLAEPELLPEGFDGLAVGFELDGQGIEIRVFGIPFQRRRHRDGDRLGQRGACLEGAQVDAAGRQRDGLAIGIGQFQNRLQAGGLGRPVIGCLDLDGQRRILEFPIECGGGIDRGKIGFGKGDQHDVAGDATKLVAGILAAAGELVGDRFTQGGNGDGVLLARLHQRGDVEFKRGEPAFMSACLLPVDPNRRIAVDPVGAELDPLASPALGDLERVAVAGGRAGLDLETLHRPFARHLDVGPAGPGLLGRHGKISGGRRIEAPGAAQVKNRFRNPGHRNRPRAQPGQWRGGGLGRHGQRRRIVGEDFNLGNHDIGAGQFFQFQAQGSFGVGGRRDRELAGGGLAVLRLGLAKHHAAGLHLHRPGLVREKGHLDLVGSLRFQPGINKFDIPEHATQRCLAGFAGFLEGPIAATGQMRLFAIRPGIVIGDPRPLRRPGLAEKGCSHRRQHPGFDRFEHVWTPCGERRL